MTIEEVRVLRVRGPRPTPAFPPGDRQAQQLDIYPELAAPDPKDSKRAESPAESPPLTALYVEIAESRGHTGLFGPIQEEQAYIILKFLRPFLLGKDAFATEALLDQMMRLHRHGRSGMFMTGVSPVDCALWDLKGKALGLPVYRLLGGPTRMKVPAYASMLGFSIEPDQAADQARVYRDLGFTAQKWFFRYGPAHGEDGIAKNVALAEAVREAVGPHYTLMFDAFMGWDAFYARQMLEALKPFQPTWVEEPIPPERVGALRKLGKQSRSPIATGEHVYTRWQVRELLENEAVDVVQTDPDWTGGITELMKICALASSFETPVVAHGHSLLPALHTAAAQSPSTVPYVEFLIQGQEMKQHFHDPIYRPWEGHLDLPHAPGLGIILDEAKIESIEEISFRL